jgi:hypothetical protein
MWYLFGIEHCSPLCWSDIRSVTRKNINRISKNQNVVFIECYGWQGVISSATGPFDNILWRRHFTFLYKCNPWCEGVWQPHSPPNTASSSTGAALQDRYIQFKVGTSEIVSVHNFKKPYSRWSSMLTVWGLRWIWRLCLSERSVNALGGFFTFVFFSPLNDLKDFHSVRLEIFL